MEYALLEKFGEGESRTIKLALIGSTVMDNLNQLENTQHNKSTNGGAWHQEYGSWMIEGTPSLPYAGFSRDLVEVELNMRLRRARILAALGPNQIAPSTTNFPLLGTATSFTVPDTPVGGDASESEFVSDQCINPHPRFATLTRNIRTRRGKKVNIRLPLFKDVNTPEFNEPVPEIDPTDPLPFHLDNWKADWPLVRGDCMAFGMGCCCLQVTFQSTDVLESRFMFDQLAGLSPIMLALTSATPIFKGRLVDTDNRWTIISQAVDCRTPEERGLGDAAADARMAGGGVRKLAKSRYDSISCYLSPDTPEEFNDIECEVDEEAEQQTLESGLDPVLAKHIGHLFTRDPLVMFAGQIEELPDDGSRTDHWESIQSTNWQTMRWKPPPPNNPENPHHIGWRTEFRSMEVQLSDFENAAYTVFIVLLTRVLLMFDLDLRMPLSKVDENMKRAHSREPVKNETWWFRKDVTHDTELVGDELFEEMSMREVMGGKGDYFPGIIPLIYAYLDHIQCDRVTFKRVDMYLTFIMERASGTIQTDADWIRNFVTTHPDYKQDSVVSPPIAHDLMVACDEIGRAVLQPEVLLGKAANQIDNIRKEEAYGSPLVAAKLSKNCRAALVRKITADRAPAKERLNSDAELSASVQDKYLADMRDAAEAGLRDF